MKNSGWKRDYATAKEVKIEDIDIIGRKQTGRGKKNHKIIHQRETKSISSSRISVFATLKETMSHFPVGLRLPSGSKNGSDVPGIFATLHP